MSKELIAKYLAARVKDKEVIGLGSGSTTELAIKGIGERIKKENIEVYGVPTSRQTTLVANESGIKVLGQPFIGKISWGFDGADEVDPEHNLIKGRGACMLAEKIIARQISANWLVVVTEDKFVPQLGTNFAVPIEIIPEALNYVKNELAKLNARELNLRMANTKYGPLISENNNFILDAKFPLISANLEQEVKCITGVVETGLFIGFNPEVLYSKNNKVHSRKIVSNNIVDVVL